MSFADQTVLITAAGDGIGNAIARAFHSAGAKVHAVDIDEGAVDTMRTVFPDMHCTVADVADPAAVARVFETQQKTFGGVQVLINCAGIAGPTAPVEEVTVEDWRRCIVVNLDATFLCCRSAMTVMRAAGGGCIINLSSTAGWHGFPLRAPYAAAKWGVIGFTKSIAMEAGPAGIRANVICPGCVDGARMERVVAAEAARKNLSESQVRKNYTAASSLRTFVTGDDIADAAMFLASPAASKMTGQVINVDGHLESFGGVDQ